MTFKMIWTYLIIAAVVSARTLDLSRKEEFRLKLDSYQAATGIADVKKDEIWNKTMKNSKLLTSVLAPNL